MIIQNKTTKEYISSWTDKYFTNTKKSLETPPIVTYGVFVRRPTLMATALATNWLQQVAKSQNFNIDIKQNYKEGDLIGAGDPMLYITGRMDHLVELETHLLQLIGNQYGLGTMPHAFIGAHKTTLEAAIAFHKHHPEKPLTILVDYFGREVTDTLEVCNHFKELISNKMLSVRLDTHGGRYVEGLDPQESYAVLERNSLEAFRGYCSEKDLKHLIGTGVSAAAIWHMREKLNQAGFEKVKIVASSGFNTEKCKIMAKANAPIDIIGTGSYLPSIWSETYATTDIICYDGNFKVKSGREFLIKDYQDQPQESTALLRSALLDLADHLLPTMLGIHNQYAVQCQNLYLLHHLVVLDRNSPVKEP